ncbi:hypothetical protein QTN25_008794 [Entamoeba marina]
MNKIISEFVNIKGGCCILSTHDGDYIGNRPMQLLSVEGVGFVLASNHFSVKDHQMHEISKISLYFENHNDSIYQTLQVYATVAEGNDEMKQKTWQDDFKRWGFESALDGKFSVWHVTPVKVIIQDLNKRTHDVITDK